MATIVKSFAISGVEGYVIEIETDTIKGQPSISIIGLADQAIREASERIQASMIHHSYEVPKLKIIINLAPGDIKKRGSHFDLAMALGLLWQSKQLIPIKMDNYSFIGELSLNGKLRPCNGVLPMVMAAKKAGIKNVIVPRENYKEAALVEDVTVFGMDDLKEVVQFMEGKIEPEKQSKITLAYEEPDYSVDFADVKGQGMLIEYIVVAAAGGHNMLMVGEPGCGKSMIAHRIPTILPKMTEEEALEVTKIYSVSGLLKNNRNLVTRRPFRSPHHNASLNSLIGGGNNAMPGEISLAHNGVLFLDEVAQFSRKNLDALRQPMEDKNVTIARVNGTHVYPANFMFVAAMNPCSCGYRNTPKCRCTDYEVLKYRQKISGPVLDRIDIQKYVEPVDFFELSNEYQGTSSKELRERVERARQRQRIRFEKIEGMNCNAQMNSALIKEFCILNNDCKKLLRIAYEKYGYSARTFNKFLRMARTCADIDGSEKIRKKDIAAVLFARDLDREKIRMLTV